MNINLANALFDDGVFSDLYQSGFITEKIFAYREMYLWVCAQMQTRGLSKSAAVTEAETKFGKERRTIWRALQCFEESELLLNSVADEEDGD